MRQIFTILLLVLSSFAVACGSEPSGDEWVEMLVESCESEPARCGDYVRKRPTWTCESYADTMVYQLSTLGVGRHDIEDVVDCELLASDFCADPSTSPCP